MADISSPIRTFIYKYICDQNPVQMNLKMIIDQYVHDQSHNFCRYLAANDGDWLERDFPKDVIPVCGKRQQDLWRNIDLAEKSMKLRTVKRCWSAQHERIATSRSFSKHSSHSLDFHV